MAMSDSQLGDKWEGEVYGQLPVQGEGTVDGWHWYFRARGQRWSFGVGPTPNSAVDGDRFEISEAWGDNPYVAGFMPHETAWGLIERGISEWRKVKREIKAKEAR